MGLDPAQARAAEPQPEPVDTEPLELAPEQWDAWRCFVATLRQWRVIAGFGAAFYDGIDANALLATMDLLGIKRKQRTRVFWQVQILESEARKLRNKAS